MNSETLRNKKSLRKKIRELKKNISAEQRSLKSETAMKQLEDDQVFIDAKTIFIFWSMDDEIDTRDFIIKWSGKKRFILPSINGDELYLKEFSGVQKLVSGDIYSIPEPEGKPFTDHEAVELAVIPGIAFDKENNRMGRGRGYYDRILHRMKGKAKLIGICYDFQIVDKVPTEPHDVEMDGVLYG